MAILNLSFMGLSESRSKATVLPIDPAGVETGTSTSRRCSPAEPQGMDCTRVRAANPTLVPSIEMACEGVESKRDMVTSTLEDAGLPGQSTFSENRVEITNDLEVFWLLSPGAEVPWKYEIRPRSREALFAPWLRNNAPVAAWRIVMV